MKTQLFLSAGALTGLALIAAPALSQSSTRPQTPNTPPTNTQPQRPGMSGAQDQQFKQMAQQLEGTWDVTVRTFAPGAAGGNQQASNQVQGTSTRKWILDNKILVEDVRTGQVPTLGSGVSRNNSDPLAQATPPGQPPRPTTPPGQTTAPGQNTPPGQNRPGTDQANFGEGFQGHGMFGYDSKTGQFQHIWCDSMDSRLTVSTGRYDPTAKTITFNVQGNTGSGMTPARPTTPSTTPGSPSTTPPPTRPTTPPTRPDNDDDDDDQVNYQVRTTEPGQTAPNPNPQTPPRPGTTSPNSQQGHNAQVQNIDRIVIKLQDPTRHTVEYFAGGSRVIEIEYTKSR